MAWIAIVPPLPPSPARSVTRSVTRTAGTSARPASSRPCGALRPSSALERADREQLLHPNELTQFGDDGSSPLQLGYAITVHRVPGLGVRTVDPGGPQPPCRPLSREALYTALTRQTGKVVVLHQGSLADLLDYAHPTASETAQRLTNLFTAPAPVEVQGRFLEDRLIHRTSAGRVVRSKSKLLIADRLDTAGVAWQYEQPICSGDGRVVYPDFTVEDADTGTTYLWEHLEVLADPAYRRRWDECHTKRGGWWCRITAGLSQGSTASGTTLSMYRITDRPFPWMSPHRWRHKPLGLGGRGSWTPKGPCGEECSATRVVLPSNPADWRRFPSSSWRTDGCRGSCRAVFGNQHQQQPPVRWAARLARASTCRCSSTEAVLQYGVDRVARYLRVDAADGATDVLPPGRRGTSRRRRRTVFSRFLRHLAYLEVPDTTEPLPELHWFPAAGAAR